MLENNVYNLMSQLIQESQSLWRIKNEYRKDAEKCSSCTVFWSEIEKQKEENVRRLESLIRDHLVSPNMPKGRTHPYEP
jgi:hypothetical protein